MNPLLDRRATRIGLGTNRLTDTAANRSFLEQAVDAGVDFIDTAHLYTSGESEAAIGAALAPFPDRLTVATKGAYTAGAGPDDLRSQFEESRRRLRTEAIELYYLHRFHPNRSIVSMMEVMAELRDAGRIRQVGVSEVSIEEIELARTVVPIAAVQNEYSLAEGGDDEVVDYCEVEGLLFVPFFPLRGGDTATLSRIAEAHGATPLRSGWRGCSGARR